jgi:hypothetical protein
MRCAGFEIDKNAHRVLVGIREGTSYMSDLGVCGIVIIIRRKYVLTVSTGFIWFRVGNSGRLS